MIRLLELDQLSCKKTHVHPAYEQAEKLNSAFMFSISNIDEDSRTIVVYTAQSLSHTLGLECVNNGSKTTCCMQPQKLS